MIAGRQHTSGTVPIVWNGSQAGSPTASGSTTVMVDVGNGDGTIGDLARALGAKDDGLVVDGVAQPAQTPLADVLVVGARVSNTTGEDARCASRVAPWEVRIVAGPAAGAQVPLGDIGLLVGGEGHRPPTPPTGGMLQIEDRTLATFHALIEPTATGAVCTPLADRVTPRCTLTPGVPVRLGDSLLCVVPRDSDRPIGAVAIIGHRRPLHRPPRRRATTTVEGSPNETGQAAEPRDPGSLGGEDAHTVGPGAALVPAVIAAVVTSGMAVVLHQPMLALFALSAVVIAAVTGVHRWWADRRAGRRRREERAATRQRAREAITERRSALVTRLRLETVDLAASLRRIEVLDQRLWERRPGHGDVWTVTLGIGERTFGEVLRGVPVDVSLGPGQVVGVAGDRASTVGLVRSLVVQLAAHVGPADVAIEFDTDEPDDWAWASWLPHVSSDRGSSNRHVVRVIDRVTSRSVVDPGGQAAVLVIALTVGDLPAACTAVAQFVGPRLRWDEGAAHGLTVPVHAACLTSRAAERAAARLAGLADPVDLGAGTSDVPALADLLPVTAVDIERHWRSFGPDPRPTAPVLWTSDGAVELDLVRDGPHALVGGTTGAGKSELLRALVVGLATCSPPDALSFVLVDYKGGAAFDVCAGLPHVVGCVTDLDPAGAERALTSVHAELARRERLLRLVGAADLGEFRRRSVGSDVPGLARLVIVVDEFAALAAEFPEFLSSLVGTAQRGRSLGVHLVLATQRPGGVITDDIRANTDLRIALRVASEAEAIDIVGDTAPAHFSRNRPGRAALRVGGDALTVVQVLSASIPPTGASGSRSSVSVELLSDVCPDVSSRPAAGTCAMAGDEHLRRWVEEIGQAARSRGAPPPHRPWLQPLPTRLLAGDLRAATDHGLLDDPAHQSVESLRWTADAGHLLVVGSVGSGCTSTLFVVAARALCTRSAQVYVVDGVGDARWDAVESCEPGVVVRLGETERLERLIVQVSTTIEERRVRAVREPRVVLVVDGIGAVRSAVSRIDPDLLDRLDRLIADGPAVGVVLAASADHAGAVPLGLLTRAVQRWVLALADPLDGATLGVHVRDVPRTDAGEGRIVALPERLVGQVLDPSEVDLTEAPNDRRRTTPIGCMTTDVHADDLPPAEIVAGATRLAVGIGCRTLGTAVLGVEAGAHVLVVGPARSGRSTALRLISSAWRSARAGRRSVWIDGRRSVDCDALARASSEVEALLAHGHEVALVVDDAERIDDLPGGLTAALASGRVSCFASARNESLRAGYGHWTQHVRRSRTGLVLGQACGTDGDVLGAILPRRMPVAPSPGRGWLVVDGECVDVVQLAQGSASASVLVLDGAALSDDRHDALRDHGLVSGMRDVGEEGITVVERCEHGHVPVALAQPEIPHDPVRANDVDE